MGDAYFNPRAPCGARHAGDDSRNTFRKISIHAPLAGRDLFMKRLRKKFGISIHAPLAGRDELNDEQLSALITISIHAPLAGRDMVKLRAYEVIAISIHAPLAGRDHSS